MSPAPRTPPRRPRKAGGAVEGFRRVRAAHATELAEDYTEAIADLIEQRGEARVGELARAMGVSHVTVVRTVARLQRDKLVEAQPHREVLLTAAGRALARASKHRHRVVVAFLAALGVSPRVAERDAEGIEHHVSDETLRAMERFAASQAPEVRR